MVLNGVALPPKAHVCSLGVGRGVILDVQVVAVASNTFSQLQMVYQWRFF